MNQSEKVLLNSRLINQVKEANNFDFIRFFLAYSVMFNHFSTLTETDPFWFVSGGFRVKGFFIISGFLVMFSFLRTPNTRIFFRKRIQRIMPAYSLTILLCALIGLFLTSLSCREYLTSSSLYTYLICNLLTFNFLSPDLPGVFDTNPLQAMNGSLWTIKVEFMLYITIPIIYWLLKRYNKLVCLLLIYILSFIYSTTCNYLDDMTHNPIYEFMKRQFPGQMMYFCSGIIILAYFPIFRKYMRYLFPVSGFKWLHVFNRMGNFSYGIFLIHFPIIQIFIHYGLDQYSFILTLALTTILSTGLGMLSWKYIEKPCLYHPKKKNQMNAMLG